MRIFSELKRIITQFIETEYWYRFRKIPKYCYEEDTRKYKKYIPYSQDNLLAHTWEGENDIFNLMVRKIEHMIVSLRKNGNQAYLYVSPAYIVSHCTEEQKEYYFYKSMEELANSYNADIWYSDKNSNLSKKKTNRFYEKQSLISIYLKDIDDKTKRYIRIWTSGENKSFEIKNYQIIDRVKKSYSLSEEENVYKINEEFYVYDKETKQYVKNYSYSSSKPICFELTEEFEKASTLERSKAIQLCEENTAFKIMRKVKTEKKPMKKWTFEEVEVTSKIGIDKFESVLSEIEPNVDLTNTVLCYDQVVNITLEEYCKLPDIVKTKVEGQRIVLKQLLELRRKIKSISKIDDCDDKYDPSLNYKDWDTFSKEKKYECFLEMQEKYKEDRKILYREIADFMAEYGNTWWD